jgi:hypothetical protein
LSSLALLRSYRWRRRLVWLGVAGALVVIAVVVFVSLPEGGRKFTETFRSGPTTQAAPPAPPIKLTRETRRAVTQALVAFTVAAVARRDPGGAWSLVTSSYRAGVTRAQWKRGELPVFPYPASAAQARSWSLVATTPDDVTVDLVFQPPKRSKRGAIEFEAVVKPVGTGSARRWLIDSFIPIKTYPPSGSKPKPAAKPLPPNFKPSYPKGRLSPMWFLLPGVLLVLLVLVPVGIGVRNWRRGVRAERAYRSGGG